MVNYDLSKAHDELFLNVFSIILKLGVIWQEWKHKISSSRFQRYVWQPQVLTWAICKVPGFFIYQKLGWPSHLMWCIKLEIRYIKYQYALEISLVYFFIHPPKSYRIAAFAVRHTSKTISLLIFSTKQFVNHNFYVQIFFSSFCNYFFPSLSK